MKRHLLPPWPLLKGQGTVPPLSPASLKSTVKLFLAQLAIIARIVIAALSKGSDEQTATIILALGASAEVLATVICA